MPAPSSSPPATPRPACPASRSCARPASTSSSTSTSAPASADGAATVVVATDDPRIVAAVEGFGGQVVMTRRDHPSGTDRVAEVAAQLDADIIVNLQGDEPLIDPAPLDLLTDLLRADPDADMATLAVPIRSAEQWHNPNCVKVVCDAAGRALYFSRSPIPFVRDGQPDFAARPAALPATPRPLRLPPRLPAAPRRACRRSRWSSWRSWNSCACWRTGWRIQVGVVEQPALGVDTYEDYQRFVAAYRQAQAGRGRLNAGRGPAPTGLSRPACAYT